MLSCLPLTKNRNLHFLYYVNFLRIVKKNMCNETCNNRLNFLLKYTFLTATTLSHHAVASLVFQKGFCSNFCPCVCSTLLFFLLFFIFLKLTLPSLLAQAVKLVTCIEAKPLSKFSRNTHNRIEAFCIFPQSSMKIPGV